MPSVIGPPHHPEDDYRGLFTTSKPAAVVRQILLAAGILQPNTGGSSSGPELTAADVALLARLAGKTLTFEETADPDPLPPPGRTWFRVDLAKFRHTVETVGAASRTTTGTVVFENAPNGALLFDSAAGLGSEGGLAEEITRIGWDSIADDSFEVRVMDATDPTGPGLTNATIGTVSVRQLQQLDRTSEGYFELSGQEVSRGDVVAGQPYVVTLVGQRPAFRAETLEAENLNIDGQHGNSSWTPDFSMEVDGEKRHLKIDDWTATGPAPGPKPAIGYLGATGIVAAKADAVDLRGPAGADGGGSGGTASPAVLRRSALAAQVDYAVPADGVLGAWTDLQSITITAAEEGLLQIVATATGTIQEAAPSGGARTGTQVRLVRTRSAADTTLLTDTEYGPRNLNTSGGTSAAFSTLSQMYFEELEYKEVAEEGDVYKIQVRHVRQEPAGAPNASATRTVRYATADNKIVISRDAGGSGGGGDGVVATTFATEVEAEAGTVGDKAISPLSLKEVLAHVRAVLADVTTGTAGKLVDAAVVKAVRDLLQTNIDRKINAADVLDVAISTVDNATLTEDQKQAFRQRIGAESEDGEYGAFVTASQRYGGIPGGLGLGPVIPAGTTHIRFTIVAEIEQAINYTTREILVSQLLDLPNLNQGDNAITHSSSVIDTAFDERDTDTPGADAQTGYLAHNGRTLLYGSDQSIGATLRVQFKESRIEPYALRNSGVKIPDSELSENVVIKGSDGRIPDGDLPTDLARLDSTDKLPVSDVPQLNDDVTPDDAGWYPNRDRDKVATLNPTATWAREDNTDDVPDDKLSANIARTADVSPAVDDLPTAKKSSTTTLVVREVLAMAPFLATFAAQGSDWDWSGPPVTRGSIDDDSDSTNGRIYAGLAAMRYSGTTHQIDVYVLDVSLGATAAWDILYFNGVELAIAEELGLQAVPWSGVTTRWRHFRTVQVPPEARPDFSEAIPVNLRDSDGDAGRQYFVGNPKVREAKTPTGSIRSPNTPSGATPPADPDDGDHFVVTEDYTWPLVQRATAPLGGDGTYALPNVPHGVIVAWYPNTFGTVQVRRRLTVIWSSTDSRVPATLVIDGTNYPLTNVGSPLNHFYVSAPLANPFAMPVHWKLELGNGDDFLGSTLFRAGVEIFWSRESGNWIAADVGASIQQVRQEVAAYVDRHNQSVTQAAYDALPTPRDSTIRYWIRPG